MKKLVSALLLAVLCVSLCAPVLAQPETAEEWKEKFDSMTYWDEGYGRTFAEFVAWCKENGINPLSILGTGVLSSQELTSTTVSEMPGPIVGTSDHFVNGPSMPVNPIKPRPIETAGTGR